MENTLTGALGLNVLNFFTSRIHINILTNLLTN